MPDTRANPAHTWPLGEPVTLNDMQRIIERDRCPGPPQMNVVHPDTLDRFAAMCKRSYEVWTRDAETGERSVTIWKGAAVGPTYGRRLVVSPYLPFRSSNEKTGRREEVHAVRCRVAPGLSWAYWPCIFEAREEVLLMSRKMFDEWETHDRFDAWMARLEARFHA